jgi:trehalose 6-phosphate phosphatase
MMNSHFPKMASDDLDLQRAALFLDVDGTLLDIATTPDRVVVPEGLGETIARLERLLGGALAIVTGRTLADLDRLFFPLRTRAAGVHGAEMRFAPNEAGVESPGAAPLSDGLWRKFAAVTLGFPGALAENKRYSFTAHYRAAPNAAAPLRAALLSLLERCATDDLALTDALCAYEIKSSGVNKGEAVRRFLERPPFFGRQPMFVGDDASDEFGFRSVADRRGFAFAVGAARAEVDVDHVFADPATVRLWLERLAAQPAAT